MKPYADIFHYVFYLAVDGYARYIRQAHADSGGTAHLGRFIPHLLSANLHQRQFWSAAL